MNFLRNNFQKGKRKGKEKGKNGDDTRLVLSQRQGGGGKKQNQTISINGGGSRLKLNGRSSHVADFAAPSPPLSAKQKQGKRKRAAAEKKSKGKTNDKGPPKADVLARCQEDERRCGEGDCEDCCKRLRKKTCRFVRETL